MMSVARELYAVADDLRQKAQSGVTLDATQIDALSQFLTALARLARNDEEELSVFRLGEAGNVGRAVVNELASEALGQMLLEESKVVRPDFRRGK